MLIDLVTKVIAREKESRIARHKVGHISKDTGNIHVLLVIPGSELGGGHRDNKIETVGLREGALVLLLDGMVREPEDIPEHAGRGEGARHKDGRMGVADDLIGDCARIKATVGQRGKGTFRTIRMREYAGIASLPALPGIKECRNTGQGGLLSLKTHLLSSQCQRVGDLVNITQIRDPAKEGFLSHSLLFTRAHTGREVVEDVLQRDKDLDYLRIIDLPDLLDTPLQGAVGQLDSHQAPDPLREVMALVDDDNAVLQGKAEPVEEKIPYPGIEDIEVISDDDLGILGQGYRKLIGADPVLVSDLP